MHVIEKKSKKKSNNDSCKEQPVMYLYHHWVVEPIQAANLMHTQKSKERGFIA
jgi:hypothetical protein